MTNKEKYDKVFIESFSVDAGQLPNLAYNEIPSWDSIGHMTMIANLEDAFSMTFELDDIIDFSSYKKGIEIIAKYGITLE